MSSNDQASEDEEEILVYVEFEGVVDNNVFNEEQLQLDMIGIDTEHPIMQINGRFYEGTYENVCGTYMFFKKNDNSTLDDPVFDTVSNFKYFAKTRKCLKMRRIFIKPRTEVLGDSEHQQCIPNLNTIKEAGIPFRYQEEAVSFWETMRNNRLSALHSYLEKQRIREEKKSQGIVLESESDEDSPFVMYTHKETSDLNRSEEISVDSVKESAHCDDQSCFKRVYSNEPANEVQEVSKDNCLRNCEPTSSIESESSMSKDYDHSSRLHKATKLHKTKVVCKRNVGVSGNRRGIKSKSRQLSLRSNASSFNEKITELFNEKEINIKDGFKGWDKSDVAETLSSLKISEKINNETVNKSEIAVIETSALETNQAGFNEDKRLTKLDRTRSPERGADK